MEADLDALGLIAARWRATVRFGPVEATTALVRARMKNAVKQMPDGTFLFDFERAASIVDYFGELSVLWSQHGQEQPRFTGSVVSAAPTADGVEVKALGAVSLAETRVGAMAARAIPGFEMIYVLARSGGFRDERLRIGGLETLPRETFEVVAPIDGVTVEAATDFGGVRFLTADVGVRAIATLDVGDELRGEFEAPVYALALVTATRTLDAEERGLAAIDLALAWLTAQLRYGLATRPDGQYLPFNRSDALAQVVRRKVVSVRGLATTRQWLRRPQAAEEARTVPLAQGSPRLDGRLSDLTLQEQQALLALTRATGEPNLLARVHALWEAIEFYVSGVRITPLFERQERRAIADALPTTLSPKQRERALDSIDKLNDVPLGIRLRQALDDEAVPITDGEIELLWRLRKLRNDVVHGRNNELPVAEDVEYATSIVARMLAYRVADRRGR